MRVCSLGGGGEADSGRDYYFITVLGRWQRPSWNFCLIIKYFNLQKNRPSDMKTETIQRRRRWVCKTRTKKSDNNLPRINPDNNLPQINSDKNIPPTNTNNNLPSTNTINNIPSTNVNPSLPTTQAANNTTPSTPADNNLPSTSADNNLPSTNTNNNVLPSTNATLPCAKANNIPQSTNAIYYRPSYY